MNSKVVLAFIAGALLSGGAVYAYIENKRAYKGPRKALYPVESLIIKRWSPRAMSGEALSQKELMSLFEAARWAPSSYNGQPWRFIYALKGTASWDKLFDLLVPFNKSWVNNAGALVLVISKNTFDKNNEPSPTHSLDTGAATQNMLLQASAMGLVGHGMSGFDYDRARKELGIPDGYTVEAMYAFGRPAGAHVLPEELRAREVPTDRKDFKEFVFEGAFETKDAA